jgi:cellulose synthase/poly-beta-1,6-N-acetylglucosamine synthase-like glycosyltransferase
MLISDVITAILLSVMLFWTGYNGAIIWVGIRSRRNHLTKETENREQLPKISIIVPTKNEEVVINRCLTSLLNLDYPKDKMEVIIVDGNSSDSTGKVCSEFVAKYPQTFAFITENHEAKGKPGALNLAMPFTTGEIVGVFDADSVPEKNVLKKVASYLNDKKIMAVQGTTTSINERKNILTRVVAMEEKAWFQALLSGKEKLHLFLPLNGSCQFIRRTVLEELGGWDENSLTEDVELALRLVEKNHLIKYAPDISSGQETPNNLSDLVKQRVRWYRGYMETGIKYGRLLNKLNKKTIDAEIALSGPFMMVISLLSYINWFLVALFLAQSTPIIYLTGLVIALTAISLVSVGIAITASERPIKFQNILWIPSIYVYWLLQIFIASWAFTKLVFRRKRVWSKTAKKGFISPNITPA